MNIVKATGEKNSKEHTLTLLQREKLVITGIDKVKSANDKGVLIALPNCNLIITGSNLQVNQFDITSGTLEVVGTIDKIDYSQGKSFLTKFFK